MTLTSAQVAALAETARALGVQPSWLEALINFETAGTWNPQIKNPLSSARGLIQFMDATAKAMGYAGGSAELVAKHPTIESQLAGPVLAYLKPYMPFKTKQEFLLSVFFPAYRKAALDTVIHANDPAAREKFQKANPGIVTVGDYVGKLERAFSKSFAKGQAKAGAGLALLALVGAAIFFLRS